MLDTQSSAQTAGAALAAQNQPHPGRIHKPNPAQIEHQRFWGTDAAMTERLLEKARYHFDAELCGSLAEAVELARANSRRGLLICGGEAIALEAADLLAEK